MGTIQLTIIRTVFERIPPSAGYQRLVGVSYMVDPLLAGSRRECRFAARRLVRRTLT